MADQVYPVHAERADALLKHIEWLEITERETGERDAEALVEALQEAYDLLQEGKQRNG